MTLTDDNGGIPFNEEQIAEYFNNLPAEKKIGELAKLVYSINKNIKKQIEAVVNIDECMKRHEKISEIKTQKLESNVNRFSTFLKSLFSIGEKSSFILIIFYIVYNWIKSI
jgi:uncharacterized protein YktB (UPF0637 family)